MPRANCADAGQTPANFDGQRWRLATGNLSVAFIQASPLGASPRPDFLEPPPTAATLAQMKQQGLVAYEDYVAWGAIEREPGHWDWTQHDHVCDAIKKAGLKYVVYDWVHFPPTWLRNSPHATLMRCAEHHQTTNYLSIFDPQTLVYYDHFYHALARHFGQRIDGVYACICGPYGEGNYPLDASGWVVNLGHCHEGYWCADPYAVASFQRAMLRQYGQINALNAAWGTTLRSFSEITPPSAITVGFKPSLDNWKTGPERRHWLDFITWYHQAMVDFAAHSIQVVLKYFPRDKVRTKPGGNAGGVNPLAWGTYCPAYAKMAAPYGIVLQPADCQGAYFGDKWLATAYKFYGVRLATEPAGNLDAATFTRRMFSDASCGATQLFTYEWDKHVEAIHQYAHLFTGHASDTQVAVLCPTTLYRLGGDVGVTIRAATQLRDLTDYDVLDELLVKDGALTKRYKALLILQGDWIEQDILNRIERWVRRGGHVIVVGPDKVKNVEGQPWTLTAASLTTTNPVRRWGKGQVMRLPGLDEGGSWLQALTPALQGVRGMDGQLDGIWTTQRGPETLLFNTTSQTIKDSVSLGHRQITINLAPHTMAQLRAARH